VAVDNFIAFKKLMCKRNNELNQMAMKMLLDNQIKTDMTSKDSKTPKEDKDTQKVPEEKKKENA